MVTTYWKNFLPVLAYAAIILLTCATTAVLALFCSVLFRKTSMSLMTTYLVLILMFCAPLAVNYFAETFFPGTRANEVSTVAGLISPFAAAFSIPLEIDQFDSNFGDTSNEDAEVEKTWSLFGCYVLFTSAVLTLLLGLMIWLFRTRWRVSQ